ncbi:hypothetical protein FHT86_002688 [Rhizobium sp. BK313]|nr:hypothetical protein [Rhizobium sp. BK313]
MGDVDPAQGLVTRLYPVPEFAVLLVAEQCVNENCIAVTVDECDRVRYPCEVVFAGRNSLGCSSALADKHFPFKR